jgi:hypothetical protein
MLVKISVICRQRCMVVWLSMSFQTKIRVRTSGTIKAKSTPFRKPKLKPNKYN